MYDDFNADLIIIRWRCDYGMERSNRYGPWSLRRTPAAQGYPPDRRVSFRLEGGGVERETDPRQLLSHHSGGPTGRVRVRADDHPGRDVLIGSGGLTCYWQTRMFLLPQPPGSEPKAMMCCQSRKSRRELLTRRCSVWVLRTPGSCSPSTEIMAN